MKEFFVNPLGNASCYPRKERVLEKLRKDKHCHKKSINFAHNINRIAYVARQNTDI